MSRKLSLVLAAVAAAYGLGACGSSTEPKPASITCDGVTPTTLSAGGHAVLDPTATSGCVRLPAAGGGGAEYLLVALSANGQEVSGGVHGSFTLQTATDTFAPLVAPLRAPSPVLSAFRPAPGPLAFDAMLRAREREVARRPGLALGLAGLRPQAAVPPTVGSKRSFKVCRTADCTGFVTVTATAQYVGQRNAIFLDDTVPANGYTPSDISTLGALFDSQLYPIDTTAFGRESDLDGNGVVVVLLTDQINKLSPTCATTHEVILGYFFGNDLDPTDPNSNDGEVFYGLVPDPSQPTCFGKTFVENYIAPTFIHEFQHMISFNHHVLEPCTVLAQCNSAPEETWLNEGLSHFAEELGGRLVASGSCTGGNCLGQYATGNIQNAGEYLANPTANYLVEPFESGGTLQERGANWLFVRWLADQSPTDSLLGTDITRALDGAASAGGVTLTGGANVAAAAQLFAPGVSFATLAGEWHLANYTESVSGFTEPSGRLRYRSWNLAGAINAVSPGPYPLRPDSTTGISYQATGTLLGGSGKYLRIVQPSGGAAVAIGLTTKNTAALIPRVAVVRIR